MAVWNILIFDELINFETLTKKNKTKQNKQNNNNNNKNNNKQLLLFSKPRQMKSSIIRWK